MAKHTDLTKQIIFFGVVGLTTLGIDLIVTVGLYNILHFPAYLASGIGFLSGFIFNFPMNRKKVFKHTKHDRFSLKTQIILYTSLSVFNLFMTSFLVEVIVASGLVSIAVAKIIVTILIAIWNFVFFKLFIFSKKNQSIENNLDERTLGGIF